jgi:hypothetical protein
MEVYKREVGEIIKRFREGRIDFQNCLRALSDAREGLGPQLSNWDPDMVRALNESVQEKVAEAVFEAMDQHGHAREQVLVH